MASLTKKQQEMVEKNHNLIFHYLKTNELRYDEYYDILAIALCKAAIRYDDSMPTTFSTYAFAAMKNACTCWQIHEGKDFRCLDDSIISLDSERLVNSLNGETASLYDILPSDSSKNEDNATGKLEADEFIKSLDSYERTVIFYLLDMYSQTEISKKIGVSRQRVSKIVGSIRKKWKRYCGKTER